MSAYKTILLLSVAFTFFVVGFVPVHSASASGVLGVKNSYKDAQDSKAKEVNVFGTDERQEDSFVNVVKGGVNRVLGILALIALIYLMRGGFQMVTSGGDDEAYGKGFTILKHGATGLILIGVAWFIISIVFWLVAQIANDPGPAGTDT